MNKRISKKKVHLVPIQFLLKYHIKTFCQEEKKRKATKKWPFFPSYISNNLGGGLKYI
jgi:hypothetical protein